MANLQAITVERHGNKCWRRFTNYKFAAKDMVAAITAQEIPQAILKLPTGFIADNDNFTLVTIQGLETDKNLLVGADGKWRGRYRPEKYRVYPFRIAQTSEGADAKKIVCIDEDSGFLVDESAIDDDKGQESSLGEVELFFDEEGKPSEIITKIMEFLANYTRKQDSTTKICKILQDKQLLKTWPVQWKVGEDLKALGGLHCIDEEALKKLSADSLVELRDSGALMVAYGQLFSMVHINSLIQLMQAEKTTVDANELVFDSIEDSGTISFDNL